MQRPLSFLIALGAVALIAVFAAARLMPSPDAVSPFESPTFEAKVRAYLADHPNVARDVLVQVEARQVWARLEPGEIHAQEKSPPNPAPAVAEQQTDATIRALLNNTPPSQMAGNPHGDVTVVLFFDYRCPFCKRALLEEKVFLAADPNARIAYRDLAILGDPSVTAARAALASARQHKYLPFHDALMAFRGDFTDTDVFGLAMQVGIDLERLKADMAAPEIDATLNANLALARALNVEGTPAYVIGEHVVSGVTSAEELKALADEVRGRGKQVGAAQ